MYLVLTAMLALNVSAEIMNAFFMLDKGLKATNTTLGESNKAVLATMESTVSEKAQYKELYTTAKGVKAKTSAIYDKVGAYYDKMIEASGGLYPEDDLKYAGKPKGKKDKDTPQRLFVQGDPKESGPWGEEIFVEMLTAKQDIIKSLKELQKFSQGTDPNTEKPYDWKLSDEDINAMIKSLPISVNDKKGVELDLADEKAKEDWVKHTFGHMPVGAVMPILRKFQNDIKTMESQIVNELSGKIGKKTIVYDQFEVLAMSDKPYVMQGETYKAEIALGAFSSQADIKVSVGGRNLTVKDGKAEYSASASSPGEKSYEAVIRVTNPMTQTEDVVKKKFKYEVGAPAGSVSADQMNVFYIGVKNPVTVAASGVTDRELKVSASSGLNMTKTGKGKYSVTATRPTTKGKTESITLSGGPLKSTPYPFRVKRIPNPVAKIANKTDGVVRSGEWKAQRGIIPMLENFDFDAKCKIISYEMIYIKKRSDPVIIQGQGGAFSGKSMNAIRAAKPGDSYNFMNVKAKCPGDKASRKINGLAFQIK
jgi:hypothetical protein